VSLIGLLLLQGAAITGLVVGRRHILLPLLATVPATTQLAGMESGALALLAVAGFGLGAHLHKLVAEQYVR
jgi:hypothetical protein